MRQNLSEKELHEQSNIRRSRHSRLVEQNKEMERLAKRRGRMSFLLLAVVVAFTASPLPDKIRAARAGDTATDSTAAASSEQSGDAAAFENSPDTNSAGIISRSEGMTESNGENDSGEAVNYNVMLDSALGPMFYYNQHDPLWADYLWGGTDPITHYGCGPTAVAMIANAFGTGESQVTPIEIADWAAENGYFSQGHGSVHGLIPAALTEYGLEVTSMQEQLNVDAVRLQLETGHMLVCLVKTGFFTESGHFIVIRNINEDGTVSIADPNSLDNTLTNFELDFILGELMTSATDDGSPLWAVGRATAEDVLPDEATENIE